MPAVRQRNGPTGVFHRLFCCAVRAIVVPQECPDTAQNRRIEIVLQPNLADLPSLDEVKTTP